MTAAEFARLMDNLATAWAKKDYATAAGFFAEDVRYADPIRYSFNGRAELLRFFQEDGGYPQRTEWHHVLFDEGRQLGAGEYSYEGTHRYHGMVLVRVVGGLVTHWREYQHVSPKDWAAFTASTVF